jgi:hypothetical protein
MLANEGVLDLRGALLVDPALTVGAGSALPGLAGMMGGRMRPGDLCVLGCWLGGCGCRRRASHQRQHQKNAGELRYTISDRQRSPQTKSYKFQNGLHCNEALTLGEQKKEARIPK